MAGKTKTPAPAGPSRSSKLTLSFGLVNVPVRYKPLVETKKPVSGRLMCEEHGATLTQGYTCSVGTPHEHPISRDDIVKGYPHPDDPSNLVQVDTSVLEEFAESRTGNAQIEKIVPTASIDAAYFSNTYLVWPDAGGEEAFDLFVAVLKKEKKAAVTTTVISKQTRTVVFRWSPELDCLIGHVCSFTSELRLAEVALVQTISKARSAPAPNQIAAAKALFESLAGEFDPEEVEDEWTPLVQSAIRQAAQGQKVAPAPKKEAAAPAGDLMAALTASVDVAKKGKKPAARKKVAA